MSSNVPSEVSALTLSKFPAYRYERVCAILEDPKHVSVMRKIVDFGCAECKFLGRLKVLPRVRDVVGVDVDSTILESFVSVSEQVEYSLRPFCFHN